MSKSLAMWSAVRKLFNTNKRSKPCEGGKEKNKRGEDTSQRRVNLSFYEWYQDSWAAFGKICFGLFLDTFWLCGYSK